MSLPSENQILNPTITSPNSKDESEIITVDIGNLSPQELEKLLSKHNNFHFQMMLDMNRVIGDSINEFILEDTVNVSNPPIDTTN